MNAWAVRWRLPHPLVLLLAGVAVAAILTWVLPAGEFERRDDPSTGRRVVVAGTYHSVEPAPVSAWAAMVAVPRGFVDAAEVVAVVLFVGGAWVVVDRLGTLMRLVEALVSRFRRRRMAAIPVVSAFFLGMGALENMQEEIIPLVPVLLLLGRRLGVDAITVVAMSAGAAMVGSAFGPTNPFQAGIAMHLAGLPPDSHVLLKTMTLGAASLVDDEARRAREAGGTGDIGRERARADVEGRRDLPHDARADGRLRLRRRPARLGVQRALGRIPDRRHRCRPDRPAGSRGNGLVVPGRDASAAAGRDDGRRSAGDLGRTRRRPRHRHDAQCSQRSAGRRRPCDGRAPDDPVSRADPRRRAEREWPRGPDHACARAAVGPAGDLSRCDRDCLPAWRRADRRPDPHERRPDGRARRRRRVVAAVVAFRPGRHRPGRPGWRGRHRAASRLSATRARLCPKLHTKLRGSLCGSTPSTRLRPPKTSYPGSSSLVFLSSVHWRSRVRLKTVKAVMFGLALVLASAIPAAAEGTFAAGLSFLHEEGATAKGINVDFFSPTRTSEKVDSGWVASLGYFRNKGFGITLLEGGYRVVGHASEQASIFGEFLIGLAHSGGNGFSSNDLGYTVGFGSDIRINEKTNFRVGLAFPSIRFSDNGFSETETDTQFTFGVSWNVGQ